LIEPDRVVLLTTAHDGALNAMTMSWHMRVDLDPPLIACVVSDRDHSFVALRRTKECSIAIPPVEVAASEPRQFLNQSRSSALRRSNVNGLKEWREVLGRGS
jgi:flavin reductase (DIM6/NTAB) family NADH-FMN oxidoreductase RutF